MVNQGSLAREVLRRGTDLTLLQKGLVLIAVPLAFQLFSFAVLGYLIHQSNEELARVENAREIENYITSAFKDLTDAGTALTEYYYFKSPSASQRYESRAKAVEQDLNSAQADMKNDPDLLRGLQEIRGNAQTALTFLNDVKGNLDSQTNSVVVDVVILKRLINNMSRSIETYHANSLTSALVADSQPVQVRLQRYIWFAVADGMVTSVLIAFILGRYLHRGTVIRVQALMENIKRLGSGQAINSVIAGNDEIAQLSLDFIKMAESVAAAQQMERSANQRIQKIIDDMPLGLLVANAEGRVEMANPFARMLFRGQPEGLVDIHVSKLFADEQNDVQDFMQLLTVDAVGRTVLRDACRLDGERFEAELSATKMESAGEERWLVMITDVTEKRQLEKLKQDFVDMVSHDLKTPLASIQGTLSLLSAGALGPLANDGQELVERAESESGRLIKLVKDLLDMARIDAGRMQLRLLPTSLASVIKHSISSVRSQAEQRQISIVAERTESSVTGDPDRLVQVVVNLLTNAIKFSGEGEKVTVEVLDDDPEWVETRVIDHGRGIPPAERDAIFERFRQVERADMTEKGGTGLGLPICKNVIEAHGGSIGVNSEAGVGSTFWFRLRKSPPVSRAPNQ